MFVGRRKELAALESAFAGEGSAFVPVYGRRRVGKSELILRFLQNKPAIYFLGKQTRPESQVREFLREAAAVLSQPLLAHLAVEGWENALVAAVAEWKGEGKLILALDEFQWTAGASPELPGVLQTLWDRQWKRSGKVMLILCGSYIGFMEREVLGEKSPLFGRRTALIHLQPFGCIEAAEFHPRYSVEDRARTYFICGGIPWYLEQFDEGRSVEMNIVATLLDEHAPLYQEPDFLLREELRDLRNYYAVLVAVAAGDLAHGEIADRAAIDNRSLHYFLQQLIDLGYIEKHYPLSDRKLPMRTVRYALRDPLLKFWFRFVLPNSSFMLQRSAPTALRERIRPHLDAYYGSCFERMCRELLPRIYEAEGVGASFEIGEYWGPKVQVGVVGLREDSWTDLGECKWGTVRSRPALERELEAKVRLYPNERNATIIRRIFTRQPPRGLAGKSGTARWHSLPELYET